MFVELSRVRVYVPIRTHIKIKRTETHKKAGTCTYSDNYILTQSNDVLTMKERSMTRKSEELKAKETRLRYY